MTGLTPPALSVLGLLTLTVWIYAGLRLRRGAVRTVTLADVDPSALDPPMPAVSVVVPARNEARKLKPALQSILEQDYPALEVVAVDDRSEDGTGQILEQLARQRPSLRVLHVDTLPEGWLGKTHTLHVEAEAAGGDLLLFTDADVVMEPDAVRRAVVRLECEGLEHLAVAPGLRLPAGPVDVVAGVLSLVFFLTYEPWAAADPSSPRSVGIDAFNLVRSSAYRSIGGHRPIALRPDDDMKLGKVLKEAGFRQGFASGRESVEVEWYGSLSALVRGLRKNVFAAADYRLGVVAAGSAAQLLLLVWPFVGLLVTSGVAQLLHGLTAAVVLGVYAVHAGRAPPRPEYAPAVPLAALVALYATWRAVLLTLVTGRVTWRSTSYPLDELKKNRV